MNIVNSSSFESSEYVNGKGMIDFFKYLKSLCMNCNLGWNEYRNLQHYDWSGEDFVIMGGLAHYIGDCKRSEITDSQKGDEK